MTILTTSQNRRHENRLVDCKRSKRLPTALRSSRRTLSGCRAQRSSKSRSVLRRKIAKSICSATAGTKVGKKKNSRDSVLATAGNEGVDYCRVGRSPSEVFSPEKKKKKFRIQSAQRSRTFRRFESVKINFGHFPSATILYLQNRRAFDCPKRPAKKKN